MVDERDIFYSVDEEEMSIVKKENFTKCKCCEAFLHSAFYEKYFDDCKTKALRKSSPYGLCPYKKCEHEKELEWITKLQNYNTAL